MAANPQAFKEHLEAQGLSIADWARANNFKVRTVYAVLHGKLKAKRGVGHKIAVAAGLKTGTLRAAA